jgi:hypothetical protein
MMHLNLLLSEPILWMIIVLPTRKFTWCQPFIYDLLLLSTMIGKMLWRISYRVVDLNRTCSCIFQRKHFLKVLSYGGRNYIKGTP